MSAATENILRAAILHIPGIGSQRLRQVIAFCGSAGKAWEARTDSISGLSGTSWFKDFVRCKASIDPEKIRLKLEQEEISLVSLGEKHYPCLLAECPDAPPLLFYKGVLKPGLEGMAVVGSRRATPYGKAAAFYLAQEIAKAGYVVVSGLARGIDTAAHRGALDVKGITWAFMAGGLDTIYPSHNIQLARFIAEQGALLSEYPPGMPAEPGNFPARNRLISGSARGVIVVEAARKSGSLITVDFALEQGREVFAVPGPIFSEQSQGTHQLLKMGAKLVQDKEDVFSEFPLPAVPALKIEDNKSGNNRDKILNNDKREESKAEKVRRGKTSEIHKDKERQSQDLAEPWNKILACLSDVPLHIDRLTALCSLPAQEIALGLLELQLADRIMQLPGQYFVLKRGK